jgi:hypothetical protein
LRRYVISRNVAGLIPDEVFEFLLIDVILAAALSMAQRLTQPLTEMSTRTLPGK